MTTPNRTQITVYIIDDEPDLLELLVSVIEMSDMRAIAFTSGQTFFEQTLTFTNDSILVLDLHMPEMDGIEVMRKLADCHNPPAILLISGHDSGVLHSAEKLGKAHNLDIIGSINKPIRLSEFEKKLSTHVASTKAKNILPINRDHQFNHQNQITLLAFQKAFARNELTLFYQPQFAVTTGHLVGLEALVRWIHPDRGLILPDQFIPLAEKGGLIKELTKWVIDRAVRQEQLWKIDGMTIAISVNISAIDITSLTLPEQLSMLLNAKRLNPTMLTLEVTESALMGELVTSLDILTRLRLKGFKLSIDDFGTGYSSLSQLHKVPFTELKIDKSFIMALTDDEDAKAIVKTCIMLGHELKMQVVAEGVECESHLEILRSLDCDIAQGYFFSQPVPVSEITENLKNKWTIAKINSTTSIRDSN